MIQDQGRTCPFVGPRSFRYDEPLFGRDREVPRLLDQIIAERIVLLFSPSGAGKTSLIQAGLIPALREEGFLDLPTIRVKQPEGPGAGPAGAARLNRFVAGTLASLGVARPGFGAVPPVPVADLGSMEPAVRRWLEAAGKAEGGRSARPVLLFDQFEEILTTDAADLAAKDAFFAELGALLKDPAVWALIALREEYVAALEPYLHHVPRRLSSRFRLDLLDRAGARQAFERPFGSRRIEVAPEASARLTADLSRVRVLRPDGRTEDVAGPYIEPVHLQIVGLRLWRSFEDEPGLDRVDETLLAGTVGDVDDALAGYYGDAVGRVAQQTGRPERSIRDWCESHLISDLGLRNQVLREPGATRGMPEPVIEALRDAYLVRAEERRGSTWYELAHDRLVEPVRKSNAAWARANLEPFQLKATAWAASDKPDSQLLDDREVASATRWAGDHDAFMNDADREFLARSRARLSRVDWAKYNRVRVLAVFSVIVAFAALISTIVAYTYYRKAEKARIQAMTAEKLATLSASHAKEAKASAEAARKQAEESLAEARTAREGEQKKARDFEIAARAAQDSLIEMQRRLGKDASQPSAHPDEREVTKPGEPIRSKLWPSGKTLRILFLNGTDSFTGLIKRSIKEYATGWTDCANLTFEFKDVGEEAIPSAHVTINLMPSEQAGYGAFNTWTGTDATRVAIPKSVPSMNLVFDPQIQKLPLALFNAEVRKIIHHDFGHVLGLIEEHQRFDRPIQWDDAATISYFSRMARWPPDTTRYRVLRLNDQQLGFYRAFDVHSVMMYEFPIGLATYRDDGTPFQSPRNVDLSPSDKVLANVLYPADVPALGEMDLALDGKPSPGSIKIPGQVARYRFRPAGRVAHVVEAEGETPVLLAVISDRGENGRFLAAEWAAEGTKARLIFRPESPDRDYYIEVRHAKPMKGTGDFSISVRSLGESESVGPTNRL